MEIKEYLPHEIEKRSFEIIEEILGDRVLPKEYAPIIKRCIHTSADFEYADSLHFSTDVLSQIKAAILEGTDIVCDTQMAKSGINKKKLSEFGGEVHCFIADDDVAQTAKEKGLTRSYISMEKASKLNKKLIFAIGNAPTALISLHKLIAEGKINPVAIIAVPVGFVNVVESKELIIAGDTPCIVARGRKGGSNIAAAICNAILYDLK